MSGLGKGIAAGCAAIGAAWMAVNHIEGWGWLVLAAILIT